MKRQTTKKTATAPAVRPEKGQTVEVRGEQMTIVRVWPFGTIDVESASGNRYRVTGLSFL